MRGLSRLVAFLFVVLLVSTGAIYYYQRQQAEANATPPPAPLPDNVAGTADRWQWSHTVDGKTIVEVSAANYRMIESPSRVELEDVELRIFGGESDAYDLVRSKRADVDTRAKTMYSEGDVEIVMRVPNNGTPPPERPMVIRSSRVHFETETGIARTKEKTFFQFAEGSGDAVGAVYNPQSKEVTLESEAHITLQKGEEDRATEVWASRAVYFENLAKIELAGPTRMERENLKIDAGDAVVSLAEGQISRVDAQAVSGTDTYPNRALRFGADRAEMLYRPNGTLAEIIARQNSHLTVATATARNEVRSRDMNLLFRENTEEALLEKSFASGNGRMESVPLGDAAKTQPRRELAADVLELQMRPDGSTVDQLLTHAPGTLTFFPANATQRQRTLWAERMTARYGNNNQLQNFRAVTTRTESQPSAETIAKARQQKQPPPAVLKTTAANLESTFHPESGDMLTMKQWGSFRFEEGARRGQADEALMHQADKYNLLSGNARIWDDSGSLQANRIRTQEPSGDLVAEGNVVSIQKPEQKPGNDALSLPGGQETLQATAAKMTTRENNQWIRYEGNARLWQGANRLHADTATIHRSKKTLEGQGNVFSQIREGGEPASPAKPQSTKPQPAKAAPASKPVLTTVYARSMLYRDNEKEAFYEGQVRMRREGLSVDSATMRMLLKEGPQGGTELEKAFADGDVRILMREADTTRRGGGEHAEYYPPEEKMVLYGGRPFFEDRKEGATEGQRLTYYSGEDRLIVDNGAKPSVSIIQRN